MSKYEIVGLMSGTSLDGLDISHVIYTKETDSWSFELKNANTYRYSDDLKRQLSNAKEKSVPALAALDKEFGREMATMVNKFISENKLNKANINAIASHGQTVYHQPQNGFSYQIGCGSTLAYLTGIPVINDFRNKDIIAGGQGAPLVPIGDKLLFNDEADAFLNLGGFCNLTFQSNDGSWKAFDVAPCNLPINKLAELKGQEYDKNGALAKKGSIDFFLLDLLNNLPYYGMDIPKSLGTEWLDHEFYPLIKFNKNTEDNLATITEHVAIQIAKNLNDREIRSVYITGGGSFNKFLLERIQHHTAVEIKIPTDDIINFKEAIVFGFLGALYLSKESNNLPSATGASKNVICGVYHCP